MDSLPFSRREFVASAGALGAVTIFAPQALAQELSARKRKAPTLRGGRFKEGILSGDPTPEGHHALDQGGRRRGPGQRRARGGA